MERLKVGVVGCGVMGVRHLATVGRFERAQAFAVADTVKELADKAAAASGAQKVYTDGRELVRDPDVQAVIFATPTAFRDDLALAALANGKHVLVEKPPALDGKTLRKMIARRGDRVAACCSGRFHAYPSARAARDFVATGALGDLRVIHCRVLEPSSGTPKKAPPAWRLIKRLNGGGIFVNWGGYDLDYLLGIAGWTLKPRLALAQTWQVPPLNRPNVAEGSDAETHVIALVLCEGGTVISYERAEYAPAHSQSAWQIVGTNGTLNLTMLYQENKVLTVDEVKTAEGLAVRELWRGTDRWEDMQDFITSDFLEAVVDHREPQTPLEKALILQSITDAVYESARSGKAVAVR